MPGTIYPTIHEVLLLHSLLLERYGGERGIRDLGMLDAALHQQRVTRMVDFSTSEVFGRFAYNVTESDATSLGAVGEARWTYAVSKLATEHLANAQSNRSAEFFAEALEPFFAGRVINYFFRSDYFARHIAGAGQFVDQAGFQGLFPGPDIAAEQIR